MEQTVEERIQEASIENSAEEMSHDDIINEEIEAEHALTEEDKAKLAAEAGEVELAEGETIDEGISDDETLAKAIQASMSEKKELFLKEMKENPNKRLYSSRIIIEFAELIEIDKNSLRYEENADDYKFNNDLMRSKTTDFGFELMSFAARIQNSKNVSIEEIKYSGRPYQKRTNAAPNVDVKIIAPNNLPPAVKEALKNFATQSASCDCCDDCENCEV